MRWDLPKTAVSIAAAAAGTSLDRRKLRPFWDPAPPLRPPRPDIAAPPFPAGVTWVGGPVPRLERLVAGGPLLVHFFEFAQLNSVRALPYVGAWRARYRERGLSVLGVHAPRFPFTRPAAAVERASGELGIDWPVAVDETHAIWRDYGCRGWPSLFLWRRGGTLAWHHLGEGDYEETEAAIRELFEPPADGWGEPVAPLRATDAPGATVIVPSPEVFPGGSPDRPWNGERGESLRIEFEAGGAFAAVEGSGELRIRLDAGEPETIAVPRSGLVELVAGEAHRRHRLELEGGPGVRLYSLQFAPAAAS